MTNLQGMYENYMTRHYGKIAKAYKKSVIRDGIEKGLKYWRKHPRCKIQTLHTMVIDRIEKEFGKPWNPDHLIFYAGCVRY